MTAGFVGSAHVDLSRLDELSGGVHSFVESVRAIPDQRIFHPLTGQGGLEACVLLSEVDDLLPVLLDLAESASMIVLLCGDTPDGKEDCGECGACYFNACLTRLAARLQGTE